MMASIRYRNLILNELQSLTLYIFFSFVDGTMSWRKLLKSGRISVPMLFTSTIATSTREFSTNVDLREQLVGSIPLQEWVKMLLGP